MKSYIEKAIENYVKPVILNYHNQFSSTDEMEEVFYEKTGWILYLTRQNDRHLIWQGATKEDMKKDSMIYEFLDKKLEQVNPIIQNIECPMICWALRYGATLKLEDLYTQFAKTIEIVVQSIWT